MVSKKYSGGVVKNEQVIKSKLAKNSTEKQETKTANSKNLKNKNKPEINFNSSKTKSANVKKSLSKVDNYAEFDFRSNKKQAKQNQTLSENVSNVNLKNASNSKKIDTAKKIIKQVVKNNKEKKTASKVELKKPQVQKNASLEETESLVVKVSEEGETARVIKVQEELDFRSAEVTAEASDIGFSEEAKRVVAIARIGALFGC